MFSSKISIFKKILIPILLVMIFQAVLLFGVITYGGTLAQLRQNSFDIFTEKVSSRRDRMQNEMIQRWSNLQESAEIVLNEADYFLADGDLRMQELLADHDQATLFLAEVAPDLLYLLRKNSVSGAFIILDEAAPRQKAGLYFRDPDPDSNPSDYSDLQVERAPSSVTKSLGIPLASNWTPQFDFRKGEAAFFQKPMRAAKDNPDVDYTDLGYWSAPFYLNGAGFDASPCISYSVPLIYQGKPIGVLGVELSVDYLEELLPEEELAQRGKGGFVLAISRESASGITYTPVVRSGAMFSQIMSQGNDFQLIPYEEASYFRMASTAAETILAHAEPLRLYNTHTPFESERWVLLGMVYENNLLGFVSRFRTTILLTCVFSFLLGILVIMLVSRKIAKPVGMLSRKVKEADPNQPILLPRLNIEEIDELSSSIEYLSGEVVGAAGKLSEILNMTDVSIGAFEHSEKNEGKLFLTDRFFAILGGDTWTQTSSFVDAARFQTQMTDVLAQAEEVARNKAATTLTLRFDRGGTPYWSRLRIIYSTGRVLGVVTDITQEMMEKKRMEYDRDYDILTNLYNRRAFQTGINLLMEKPEQLKIAALIMMDLDNLKFVNDTYGHDLGDEYIRAAATALKKGASARALVARLSGDEFVVFLHGFDDRKEIRQICDGIQAELQRTIIMLPDSSRVPVRASAGLAWYPDDARTAGDLVRYADFAMYMVKRTNKGQFTDFNIETYHRDSYLLHGKEELNLILERGLLDYQFQPIFDAKTGEIYGHEALMRPRSEIIRTPLELLSLARSQSKLAQVEKLTMFRAMECYQELDISTGETKIFLNSIPSQVLSAEQLVLFAKRFHAFLQRIVIEITEEEHCDPKATEVKLRHIRQWNAALALDDFGVGYNGESALVELAPQYIKLDITIVKNIHTDPNRHQLLTNLIAYSRERNIKVIAEGVEYKEDLDTLIRAGVDYLQGFYMAKPSLFPQSNYPACTAEIQAFNAALPHE